MSSTLQEDLMKLIGPSALRNGELASKLNSNMEHNDDKYKQDIALAQKPVRSRSKVKV